MSKVTFNDHLDDMMERLMDEKLESDDLELEIKRSKALCQIADKKIESQKSELEFVRLISSGDIKQEFVPTSFLPAYKQIDNGNT